MTCKKIVTLRVKKNDEKESENKKESEKKIENGKNERNKKTREFLS